MKKLLALLSALVVFVAFLIAITPTVSAQTSLASPTCTLTPWWVLPLPANSATAEYRATMAATMTAVYYAYATYYAPKPFITSIPYPYPAPATPAPYPGPGVSWAVLSYRLYLPGVWK